MQVLNAFRHLVCNHGHQGRIEMDDMRVLNAFRHLVCNHLVDRPSGVGQELAQCSTPFGIWYVITGC